MILLYLLVYSGERVMNKQLLVNKYMPTVTIPSLQAGNTGPVQHEYREVPIRLVYGRKEFYGIKVIRQFV